MNSLSSEKKATVIIQARLGSTRLPGKVLKSLCGKPILWHVWNRLTYSKNVDEIIIATTDQSEDDLIESFCRENSIPFFRGSTNDVLNRYYETAKNFRASTIIRVTSDCPLIDPIIIDQIITSYRNEKADYMSNVLIRSFPRGLDVEIFSFELLERADKEAALEYEREHVTPFIYNKPELFALKNFVNSEDLSFHRWTVDTEDDFRLIEIIYKSLYGKKEIFLMDDILNLFKENPDLLKINKQVEQKKLGE